MTDYLKELLDNANALLEQVRRLERGGAPLRAEESGAGEGSVRPRWLERMEEMEAALPMPQAEGWSRRDSGGPEAEGPRAGTEEAADLQPPRRGRTPLEQKERDLPLLEQVERLERALALPPAGTEGPAEGRTGRTALLPAGGLERGSAVPGGAGAAGLEWSGLESAGRPGYSGGLDWAEQADRAFRRDSRRYDGGFYLY